MLLRLCQLKSLALILIVVSCSKAQRHKESSNELVSMIEAKWFATDSAHSLFDQEGKIQTHLFFDVRPELSSNGKLVNVVVTTPENSENSYALDLNSGQRYFDHSYCKQKDIWNLYSGTVGKPHFSIAFIPRMLDQLGEPQKVIVFGGEKKFFQYPDFQYHQVRFISAYVEQNCLDGNCLGKSNWVSRLVFVAVDPDDPHFATVESISDFEHAIDWPFTKATLENMDGHNGLGDKSYPSVRIGQLIPIEEAAKYQVKRSLIFSEEESSKIQKSCFTLYDRLYAEVGVEHEEDKPAKTVEELKAKVKLREELKKKKVPIGFAARLKVFAKKYSNEMASCEKFVYHGNLNQDPDKFWFLSYMGIFFRLNKEGYYFDCDRKSWQQNILDDEGNPIFELKRDIDKCVEKDFDIAMNYLPNFLMGLKGSSSSYYKFIDYDTHAFGTHRKLYSWVKVRTRKFNCSNELNEAVQKETKVLPEDVNWRPRDVKDIEDKMKIIY